MGFLSNIFSGKKTNLTSADLSVLKTDIHSHFLPGIDDGAATIEDSVELISQLYNFGYRKIITTPHIISDSYRNTPEIIFGKIEIVRAALKEANIPIEIEAAAEYYLDYDFERKIDEKKLLTFGNNYVLFEVSFLNPPDNLNNIIFKLLTSGYKPVLAHPERYNFWHRNFAQYEELKNKGVLLQLNINSLTGYYSPKTKKIAEQLIDKDMIDFLGTDCHHKGHIELLKKVVKESHLSKLLSSGKLLNNTL